MQVSTSNQNYFQNQNQEIKKLILSAPTDKLPKVIEKINTPPINENKIEKLKGFEIYA